MPGDNEIKIIFKRVYVRNDADWFGSGEFYFLASIGGVTVGDRRQIFNAREGHWINLSETQWSWVIDVSTTRQVDIRFEGRDQDLLFDDNLGLVTATLRPDPAWQQRLFRRHTNYYTVEIEVQLSVGGRFGRHGPEEVFTCREHSGSHRCTTVSGNPCPVPSGDLPGLYHPL